MRIHYPDCNYLNGERLEASMHESSTYDLFIKSDNPNILDEKFHLFGLSNILNVVYWDIFFKEIEGLPDGLLIECGVGRGRSLMIILALEEYYASVKKRVKRNVFALDSFEGFPEPSTQDESPRMPKKGEWSKSPTGQYSYTPDFLKEVLTLGGVNQESLKIVKGFFNDTISGIPKKPIALLHLDGDLYESYKVPLVALSNQIQIGGIIVIDDFLKTMQSSQEESFPGARQAVMEFLDDNKNFDYLVSIRGTPYLKRSS